MNTRATTVWLTGIPRSGKSTLAYALQERLRDMEVRAEVLDGDEIRAQISGDLGFSKADRELNVRRIGYVAELLTRNGIVAIVSAVSPYRDGRDANRKRLGRFLEVYCRCHCDIAAGRDFKGLYEKALRGEVRGLTGFNAPYEAPFDPEVTVNTDSETVVESLDKIWSVVRPEVLDTEKV